MHVTFTHQCWVASGSWIVVSAVNVRSQQCQIFPLKWYKDEIPLPKWRSGSIKIHQMLSLLYYCHSLYQNIVPFYDGNVFVVFSTFVIQCCSVLHWKRFYQITKTVVLFMERFHHSLQEANTISKVTMHCQQCHLFKVYSHTYAQIDKYCKYIQLFILT